MSKQGTMHTQAVVRNCDKVDFLKT